MQKVRRAALDDLEKAVDDVNRSNERIVFFEVTGGAVVMITEPARDRTIETRTKR